MQTKTNSNSAKTSSIPFRANSLGAYAASSSSSSAASSPIPSYSNNAAYANGIASSSTGSNGIPIMNGSLPFQFRQSFQSSASQHANQQQQQMQQFLTVERYTADLTNCIIAFLTPILPTEEEYRIKEATRRQLERLTGKVSPGAKLLAFGSMANGFALKNSDMDLCCLLANDEKEEKKEYAVHPEASHLVEELGKLLRQETDYNVMPLPKARIPIIKISRPPTAELSYEISCDIGFENRLALENTRLLLSYAMVDPPRLRTLVLFLKVWTKRRKLNSPFTGTLSSYGYTLMMLFFLTHVKRPAVLPNLQRIPPSTGSQRKVEEVTLNGHNVYFYDDVAKLRKEWTSFNTENVGELLLDFFKYFSKDFGYSRDVISIKNENGVIPKDANTWNAELCIEDPFQSGYNVARTVTKDGLYTIRGEFMRAYRILTTRIDRVSFALAELCEEREDGLTRAPDPSQYYRQRPPFLPTVMNPALYLPSGGFDPRYLRDVTRRFEAGSLLNGYGGSFAFEEMARGLAQVQHGGSAVAYPPTAAMLAPLSQNVGLSPRQNVMRAGLRYDVPRKGQSSNVSGMQNKENIAGNSNQATKSPKQTRRDSESSTTEPTSHSLSSKDKKITNKLGSSESARKASNSSNQEVDEQNSPFPKDGEVRDSQVSKIKSSSVPRIPSSARSDDGGASSYERRKNKQRWNLPFDPRTGSSNDALGISTSTGNSSGNVSARTSPRSNNATVRPLLHPSSAISGHNASYGIGEAFAYGTEISFGSQRFQLHPQSPKQRSNLEGRVAEEVNDVDERTSLSANTLDDDTTPNSILESSRGGDDQQSDGEPADSDVAPFDDDESDDRIIAPVATAATTTTTMAEEGDCVELRLQNMNAAQPTIRSEGIRNLHVGKEHDVRSWAASQREQLDQQTGAN